MPPHFSGSFNARDILRAWCLLALLLSASAALLFAPQNAHAALTDGLVGWWTFDGADVADKVYDRSAQGNHGYYVNSAFSTSTAKVQGKLGQALNFSSSTVLGSYVEANGTETAI